MDPTTAASPRMRSGRSIAGSFLLNRNRDDAFEGTARDRTAVRNDSAMRHSHGPREEPLRAGRRVRPTGRAGAAGPCPTPAGRP
ncbi:hypothetical protein CZ771_08855 [Actinomycetales bacterium JB111]|nr:hypothetical protein CZ771_08855 [Actinomycetales bacterium JB111]